MKSLRITRVLPSVVLSMLCTLTMAEDGDWKPGSSNTTRFENLEQELPYAKALLYLNDTCQVVAFLVPSAAQLNNYLPAVNRVRHSWHQRARKLPPSVISQCKAIGNQNMVFLAADNKTNPNNKTACDPNADLAQGDDLVNTICQTDQSKIESVIVIDDDFDPVLILRGQLAQDSAAVLYPAAFLGRKKLSKLLACSPTVPTPCDAPKSGKIKTINGTNVCVCS